MEKRIFSTQNITEFDEFDRENVGTLRWVGNKVYRWVKNESVTTLALGDVLCHTLTNTDSMLGKVSTPAAADLSMMAGVAVSLIPPNYYGWVQVQGHNATITLGASATTTQGAGDYCIGLNGTTGAVSGAASAGTIVHPRNLILLEEVANTTVVTADTEFFVNCL